MYSLKYVQLKKLRIFKEERVIVGNYPNLILILYTHILNSASISHPNIAMTRYLVIVT